MKLRNKKTGEIIELELGNYKNPTEKIVLVVNHEPKYRYNSLAELNEDWEDYKEPKEDALSMMILTLTNFIENEPTDNVDLEDCKQMLEKLKAWTRLEDKGIKTVKWTAGLGDDNYKIGEVMVGFDINGVHDGDVPNDIEKDLDLLFGGEK